MTHHDSNDKIITIITPSMNQCSFIQETIDSVLSQSGDFYIDYIIMDGGSKDNSVEIIKNIEISLSRNYQVIEFKGLIWYIPSTTNPSIIKCKGISFRWFSKEDNGQADAINQGIKLMVGDIFSFLNSDDILIKNSLKIIASQNFKEHDIIYGKGLWISKNGSKLLPYPTFKPNIYSFYYQCTICQPTVFIASNALKEIGFFDNNFNCTFDYEYWSRAIKLNKKFKGLNYFIAKSRMYNENKSLLFNQVVKKEVEIIKLLYFSNIKNKFKLKLYYIIDLITQRKVYILNKKLQNNI
jgi:glycosyltransferase involved in cell wall biosynthesis